MAINKVDYFGRTLMDLTGDTVTPETLMKGATAHDKAGYSIVGTASAPKPEQEKEVTITENGDFPITPDVGKVLSKVLAHVNVPTGGGGGGFDPAPFTKVEIKTFVLPKKMTSYRSGVKNASLVVIVENGPRVFDSKETSIGVGVAAPNNSPFTAYDIPYGTSQGLDVNAMNYEMLTYGDDGYIFSRRPFAAGKEYILVAFFGPEV